MKYIVYNKEKDNFDEYDFKFDWLHIQRETSISEIECNYYLYKALIRKFYIDRKLKYYKELYDDFYNEQFHELTINN